VAETGFVSVADLSLEYERLRGRRPTVVMLHEGLGCVAMWKEFPVRLNAAAGLEVFVYSRAGHGGSSAIDLPRPLDCLTRDALDVLPRVLDAASIDDCILLGHSDGASIAIVYAGARRDPRVRALILIAPHVLTEVQCVETITAARRRYETGDLRTRLERHHGDNVDCAFRGWCDTWLDPGFLSWNIERYLAGIDLPVLCLRGEDDAYSTSIHVKRIAAQVRGPVETVNLSGCGHSPQIEQMDLTLGHVVDFLARTGGRE
jgi:pimeloyl-ACP methyl ester carboxylesterase